ncbi:MAG: hypothetical protein IJE23_01190 [Tyzzerella sp.]|nr:hypothetical protein [Tyzzerella sp.]
MEWKIVYAHHDDCFEKKYCSISELERSGFDILPAKVPGNFEIDLMETGRIKDLYFGTNTLEAQKLEDVHVWYFAKVKIEKENQYLRFEGIDTFSDIYVNGKLVKSTDNMFISYDVEADWILGENEVVVHIKPMMLEARKYTPPVVCHTMRYNYPTLYVRKAAHMVGWDIMPRIVSAGLWKEVRLLEKKEDSIEEVYFATHKIEECANGQHKAEVRFYVHTNLKGVFTTDYKVRVEGRSGHSKFLKEQKLWHNTDAMFLEIEDCQLWWPKHAGNPNLYDVTVTLLRDDIVCDTYQFQAGIRTVELERTDVTDRDGNGEFCFKVNGRKIFVLGTNWVPLDALHSNDRNRLPKALELLDEIGCNMVRCWGGNVYESDEFFEYCDRQGILIWQDFAMGCAVYPDEDIFAKKLEQEAIYQIKRLRNHPALALWAGDNECDMTLIWGGINQNPNHNRLTRNVLSRLVELHDYSRPYLPSSPFMSDAAYNKKGLMPEDHLWGPRDYFKGSFYKDTFVHFASETGYHGFPSPKSLKRFLEHPEIIFDEEGKATDEYIVHAASMELEPMAPYVYRIKLAYDQVVTLFGKAAESLDDFVCQSQISQAEAKKYFIEKFRVRKWKCTGIIWWNLLDGWPQVSDAIVDYYYTKKLAFHYIKRSQEPVCLMFAEPENGKIQLMAANDLSEDKVVSYTVKKFSDTDHDDEVVLSGEKVIAADTTEALDSLEITNDEKNFYYIEWTMDGERYKNHYFTNIINIDYDVYMQALKKYGMDEFEGFFD